MCPDVVANIAFPMHQGWRLDPLLLFGQLLTAGAALSFGVEALRLREIVHKKEVGPDSSAWALLHRVCRMQASKPCIPSQCHFYFTGPSYRGQADSCMLSCTCNSQGNVQKDALSKSVGCPWLCMLCSCLKLVLMTSKHHSLGVIPDTLKRCLCPVHGTRPSLPCSRGLLHHRSLALGGR